MIQNTIIPKLEKSIEDWNPTVDTVPIHIWLHPWLPHLPASVLAPLFPPIRKKLATSLKNWHPSDDSAFNLLEVWKDVFDENSLANLLEKCVIPKLAKCLRRELRINPANQEMKVMEWVLKWRELVRSDVYAALVEGEILLPWLNVLYRCVTTEGAQKSEIKVSDCRARSGMRW